MALTKTEKDFWIAELRAELQVQIDSFQDEVDVCMEIAKINALESLKITGKWKRAQALYKKMLAIHAQYKNEGEAVANAVRELNEILQPYKRTVSRFGGAGYSEAIRLATNFPSTGYHNEEELCSVWLEQLAKEYYLEDVMVARGITQPLDLAKAQAQLKRQIMLATSSTQLKEFLQSFMEIWDIKI